MNFFSLIFPSGKQYTSKINGILTVGKVKNVPAVFGGGVTQSGGELVRMWDTVISTYLKKNTVSNFLLLGVGAGMIFHIIRKYFPQSRLVGIDKDPLMIDIGKEHFNLSLLHPKIIIANAISWILKNNTQKFDLIIVDLYIGRYNAPATRRRDFLEALKHTVKKNGIILYNCHYDEQKPKEFSLFLSLCKKIFTRVEIVSSYPLNRILLLA